MKNKAFTLAEVMITLTVIGIITAIIIPVAINSKPDENIMKFKKAHNTLYQTISELVNSDKYYCDGDLGMKADCKTQILSQESTITYLCETMADVISTKSVNCNTNVLSRRGTNGYLLLSNEDIINIATGNKTKE